ncbi:MAG: hypothetical protein AAGG55_01525 [Pseudomonadota bacterium]
MSVFRLVKYSSIIFFLNKHRGKLFRSIAVLLFALVTSLLYEDVRVFLAEQHPDTLIYALVAKITIVYGSLAFVLWQFRPEQRGKGTARAAKAAQTKETHSRLEPSETPDDRLQALADVDAHDRLRSRYDRVLAGESSYAESRSSTKSSRS